FENEAKTLQRLPHENLIAYVGYFRYHGLFHLVMELASHTLHDAIVGRRIDTPIFLKYAKMMAVGIVHLHSHQILHGDLKPVNILITEQNVIKLADLGEMRNMTT
ncbi:Cyclin-dependent kinase 20, partial [Linnemannia gamsii]